MKIEYRNTEEDNQTTLDYLKEVNYQMLNPSNEIKIPLKVHKVVNHIKVKDLKQIHKDKLIAKEYCLLMLSQLTITGINSFKENNRHNGIPLYSQVLLNAFGPKYKTILNVLLKGTNNGPFIKLVKKYSVDNHSNIYSLTDRYFGSQIYAIQTPEVRKVNDNIYLNKHSNRYLNVIVKSEIQLLTKITLPTKDEIIQEARRITKHNQNHKDKIYVSNGKLLTFKGKYLKSHWKDVNNRTFVEDGLEIFEYLFTPNNYFIPVVSKNGRVITAFNLIPKWIRSLIKIDGKSINESDYKSLHPNIIMNLYNGNEKYITHDKIANKLGITRQRAKLDHISFFNDKANKMNHYKVRDYYENKLINRIKFDKECFGHKITSSKLLRKESDIMEQVINILLNVYNIQVMYVFDALYAKQNDLQIVSKVMNQVAVNNGVYTTVDGNIVEPDHNYVNKLNEDKINKMKEQRKQVLKEVELERKLGSNLITQEELFGEDIFYNTFN